MEAKEDGATPDRETKAKLPKRGSGTPGDAEPPAKKPKVDDPKVEVSNLYDELVAQENKDRESQSEASKAKTPKKAKKDKKKKNKKDQKEKSGEKRLKIKQEGQGGPRREKV